MFVVRPTVLLDLLAQWHPEFAADLRTIAAEPDRLDELWSGLPKIALDHAIAEPAADAGRVACVPSSFHWEDIGDFDSLASLLATEETATTVLGRRRSGPGHRLERPGRPWVRTGRGRRSASTTSS